VPPTGAGRVEPAGGATAPKPATGSVRPASDPLTRPFTRP
jgi:hypothetical protein